VPKFLKNTFYKHCNIDRAAELSDFTVTVAPCHNVRVALFS
jgi:hypothetical protein